MPILSQITIYPIKSLAGIEVERWPVVNNGLKWDRKWMLVDADGQFLSQRRLAKMALIGTRLDGEHLIVNAPGQSDLAIGLNTELGETLTVTIWRDECLGKAPYEQADAWFSQFLGVACRLVYHPDQQIRQVDLRFALPGDQTAYSDGFPFLIISDASLQALNQAMGLELEMQRFRPNLVVSQCDSYAEDYWRRISINNIGFRLPKPCSRCSIPTIDPLTALSGKEPLKTLAKYRQVDNKVYFGQNALHDQLGELHIGSEINILETGSAQPLLAM